MKKSKLNCMHQLEYQKWVHYSKSTGAAHSFHYKQVCTKCGWSKYVERTKYLFNLLKDAKWHSKYKR